MARRKSPAEVGPLGVWAYDTRVLLDRSVEEVIAALPTTMHPATLRKVEGGSARPGTRMWRELGNLYVRLAAEKGETLDPQPRLTPEPVGATETPDALVAALRDQTEAISALVAALRDNSIEVRLRVLEAVVLPQARPDAEGLPERSAPGATAG